MTYEKMVVITGIVIAAAVFSDLVGHEVKKYLRYLFLFFIVFFLTTRGAEIIKVMDEVAIITWPTVKEWIINGSKKLVDFIYFMAH